jgi:hypothetical protein
MSYGEIHRLAVEDRTGVNDIALGLVLYTAPGPVGSRNDCIRSIPAGIHRLDAGSGLRADVPDALL